MIFTNFFISTEVDRDLRKLVVMVLELRYVANSLNFSMSRFIARSVGIIGEFAVHRNKILLKILFTIKIIGVFLCIYII